MKIDGILMKDVETIENNYDNLEILKIIRYLTGVVINDIQFMNTTNKEYLDLGNDKKIKRKDFERLYEYIKTIYSITKDNE